MEDNKHFDDVLIRLRRTYGKDEAVLVLNKKCSNLEVENGKLKSEIDYLNEEIEKLNQKQENIKQSYQATIRCELGKMFANSKKWIEKEDEIKNLKSKIAQLQIDNKNLILEINKKNK